MTLIRFLNDTLRDYVQGHTGEKLRSMRGYEIIAAFLGYDTKARLDAETRSDPDMTRGLHPECLIHARQILVNVDLLKRCLEEEARRREEEGQDDAEVLETSGDDPLPPLPDARSVAAVLHRAVESFAGRPITLTFIEQDGQPVIDQVRPSLLGDLSDQLSGEMVDARGYFDEFEVEEEEMTWDSRLEITCHGMMTGTAYEDAGIPAERIVFSGTASYERRGGRCGLGDGHFTASGEVDWRNFE